MPVIKSVSCSTTTQTNTRLCGLVQISEFVDKYRLNCFYCMATYNLDKWYDFVQHLKVQHYQEEEAFKNFQYLSEEHDYTPIGIPTTSKGKEKPECCVKTNSTTETSLFQNLCNKPLSASKLLSEIPQILALTQNNITIKTLQEVPANETIVTDIDPPPLAQTSTNDNNNNQTFSITLADKLIKLLDETVLNPNFQNNKTQNMNIVSNKLENLNNFIENKTSSTDLTKLPVQKSKPKDNQSTVYSLMGGPKYIAKRRNSVMSINKKRKVIIKKLETKVKDFVEEPTTSAKNVKSYESVYKTMKTKPKVSV